MDDFELFGKIQDFLGLMEEENGNKNWNLYRKSKHNN